MSKEIVLDSEVVDVVNVFLEGQQQVDNKLSELVDVLTQKELEEEENGNSLETGINELVEFLEKKEEKSDVDQERLEKLLTQEELTEEEQLEIELLQQKEEEFNDLETGYLEFRNANQEAEFDYLESINQTVLDINENLEMIIEQNEISNHADHIISIYGMIVIPAILIFYFFMKILSRYV